MEEFIKKYEDYTGRKFVTYIPQYDEYVFDGENSLRAFLRKQEIKEMIAEHEENLKKKPLIQFELDTDFSFVSNWIPIWQFNSLREEAAQMAAQYLLFVQTFSKEVKGINIKYESVDFDDFGTHIYPKPVKKWNIVFSPSNEEGYSEEICD